MKPRTTQERCPALYGQHRCELRRFHEGSHRSDGIRWWPMYLRNQWASL